MWLAKTAVEMRAAKKSRRLRGLFLAAMSCGMSLYLLAISPAWHGRQLLGVFGLPIHALIPEAAALLAALALVLADCYWLLRSPASKNTTLICQQCNRLNLNDGQTQCHCGGKFLALQEMKWVDGPVSHDHQPLQTEGPNPKSSDHSLAAAL